MEIQKRTECFTHIIDMNIPGQQHISYTSVEEILSPSYVTVCSGLIMHAGISSPSLRDLQHVIVAFLISNYSFDHVSNHAKPVFFIYKREQLKPIVTGKHKLNFLGISFIGEDLNI